MSAAQEARDWNAGLLRILVGHVCLHAAMVGARMAAPLLALGQGYSNASAGVLVALFAATQIFLSIPAGRYADRHGLKRPVQLCITAAVAGAGFAALFPAYWALCFAALLLGGAAGAATITLQRHAGRMAQNPTQVRQVFSWLATAPAVSNFLGPLATGFMIDHAGFRWAFALLAVLPLATWWLLRSAREIPNDAPPPGARPPAWDLLRSPLMRRLLVMNWLMSSCWDMHGFMVPVLGHERGLSASTIGAILGTFAVAAVVIRLGLPVLASRVREWAVITGALALAAATLIVYPFTQGPLQMALCSMFIGLGLGFVQPMIMSTLHQITPRHRQGEALAIRMIMVNLCSVSMPLFFGATSAAVGVSALFWGMGTFVGGGSLLGLKLREAADKPAGH